MCTMLASGQTLFEGVIQTNDNREEVVKITEQPAVQPQKQIQAVAPQAQQIEETQVAAPVDQSAVTPEPTAPAQDVAVQTGIPDNPTSEWLVEYMLGGLYWIVRAASDLTFWQILLIILAVLAVAGLGYGWSQFPHPVADLKSRMRSVWRKLRVVFGDHKYHRTETSGGPYRKLTLLEDVLRQGSKSGPQLVLFLGLYAGVASAAVLTNEPVLHPQNIEPVAVVENTTSTVTISCTANMSCNKVKSARLGTSDHVSVTATSKDKLVLQVKTGPRSHIQEDRIVLHYGDGVERRIAGFFTLPRQAAETIEFMMRLHPGEQEAGGAHSAITAVLQAEIDRIDQHKVDPLREEVEKLKARVQENEQRVRTNTGLMAEVRDEVVALRDRVGETEERLGKLEHTERSQVLYACAGFGTRQENGAALAAVAKREGKTPKQVCEDMQTDPF